MQTIKLTKNLEALVDDDDFDFLSAIRWYADVGTWTTYAKTDHLPKRPRMHVVIMRPPTKLIVHHKNKNGLDNRKDNLEIMTQAEHSRLSSLRRTKQTSRFRGVSRFRDKFAAEITYNYQKTHLGLFRTEEEAAFAYNNAAISFFGPTAVLNEL